MIRQGARPAHLSEKLESFVEPVVRSSVEPHQDSPRDHGSIHHGVEEISGGGNVTGLDVAGDHGVCGDGVLVRHFVIHLACRRDLASTEEVFEDEIGATRVCVEPGFDDASIDTRCLEEAELL